MKFRNLKTKNFYEYLSGVSRKAYSDSLLISNDVLCKQDTRARLLETFFSGDTPQKVNVFFMIKKTFFYFTKNLISFLLYLFTAFAHLLSRQLFRIPETGEMLVLDKYFVAQRILDERRHIDSFFFGLTDVLDRRKKKYVYIPKLYGTKNPFKWFRVFRIFKKNGDPILTEFQILGFLDYLEVFWFIFIYPISVWRFAKNLGNSCEDEALHYGLWQAFDSIAFGAHVRFLLGKRLSGLKIDKIKCFSWYENQVFDKNFYRGLRSFSRKIEIIGAQLFIRPCTILNITPDDSEVSFNVLPDKVLVNGPGYLFESKHIQVDVGPSLRYAYLFNTKVNPSKGEVILILLPVWDNVVRHILKVIQEVDWPVPVEIKFHPSTNKKTYRNDFLKPYFVTNKTLLELLPRVRIVVGHSSGTLLEAVALGIPVINLQNPGEFSHDYMPEVGKGVLWENAVDASGVAQLVRQFQEALQSHPCRLKEEGGRLRSIYFSEPTDELIGQAFELESTGDASNLMQG
jgi:hypothetical protein